MNLDNVLKILLFPAYAGVILFALIVLAGIDTFPRIRGGDPDDIKIWNDEESFSPHTRW